jgi:invasion protein IalB
MRTFTMACAISLALASSALAQTNRAGIDSNITPIVPDSQVGLPDKAAPADGGQVVPPNKGTKASNRANPTAKETAPAAAPRAAATEPKAAAAAPAPAFGEWRLECVEQAAKPNCQASIRAVIGEQIALVLSVAMQAGKPDPQMQLAVPLGVLVAKGVDAKVGGYSANFPISRCTAQGCLVEGAFPKPFGDALREGKDGAILIYSTDGKPVQLPLPAKSFATAFDGLTPVN